MVPACSVKVPRVSTYSGYRHVCFPFVYGTFTLSGLLSQNRSTRITESITRSEPRSARTPVWPLSISLAATLEIEFSFFSSPYLDVSVQAVPCLRLFDSTQTDGVLLRRVSPFGNLRVKGCLRLTEAYRSLPRPSSAPDAKAFPLRSY